MQLRMSGAIYSISRIPHPFLSAEWMFAWLKHSGPQVFPVTLIVRDENDQLVAVWPFFEYPAIGEKVSGPACPTGGTFSTRFSFEQTRADTKQPPRHRTVPSEISFCLGAPLHRHVRERSTAPIAGGISKSFPDQETHSRAVHRPFKAEKLRQLSREHTRHQDPQVTSLRREATRKTRQSGIRGVQDRG